MGYKYVCSDLHGRYDKYQAIMKMIRPEDELYILGDVIDRSPDGMKILTDIIERDNVCFFIGNHELMMWCTLFENDDPTDGSRYFDSMVYRVWTHPSNGGRATLNDYLDNYADRYDEIREYLLDSYVCRTIEEGGHKFCLSHTSYYTQHRGDVRLRDYGQVYYDDDYFWCSPFDFVDGDLTRRRKDMGDRVAIEPFNMSDIMASDSPYFLNMDDTVTYIGGHVFVQRLGISKMACMVMQGQCGGKDRHILFADIDGGCAISNTFGYMEKPSAILYNITEDKAVYI